MAFDWISKTNLKYLIDKIKGYIDTYLAGKSDSNHTHDSRYYTETEIDNKIATVNSNLANKQDVLIKGVPSDTSFDTINVPGIYWINPGVTTGNHPYPGEWGVLEVWEATTGAVMQRFTVFHNGLSATRCYANNQRYTWQNKVGLWTDSEGGNIVIWGPNNNQWEIDSYDSSMLRFYTWNNGVYKCVHFSNNGDLISDTGDIFNSAGTSLQGVQNNKSDLIVTTWNTQISGNIRSGVNFLLLLNQYAFSVWIPSTSDIHVVSLMYGWQKTGQGSVAFSPTAADGSQYQISRNGNAVTVTCTTGYASMKIIS